MKHLITMTACLMILMAMLSQFVQNQKLLLQLEQGSYVIDLFCNTGDRQELTASLSRIMGCREDDIIVQEKKKTVIISAPVVNILANPEFWGLNPEDNSGIYRWERMVSDG